MGKMNIGKIVMMALQEARERGIVPSEVEKRNYIDFGKAAKKIETWERKGKIVCIERGRSIHLSTYVLKKYEEEHETKI